MKNGNELIWTTRAYSDLDKLVLSHKKYTTVTFFLKKALCVLKLSNIYKKV